MEGGTHHFLLVLVVVTGDEQTLTAVGGRDKGRGKGRGGE